MNCFHYGDGNVASFSQCAEAEEMHVDNRSVDDLLSFINGGDEGKLNFFFLPTFLCSLVVKLKEPFCTYIWWFRRLYS